MYVKCNIMFRSCNHRGCGKAISVKYFQFLSIVASYFAPVRLYHIFYTLSHKVKILGKHLLNTKCVLIFCTPFVWKISHCKKNRLRFAQKCILVFIYSTLYSYRFLIKFLLRHFSKNTQIPNFVKIRPVEANLFHADRQRDGRSDMRKLLAL